MVVGEEVVRILNGAGCKTASFAKIEWIVGNEIKLEDSALLYDKRTLQEIRPVLPGFFMEIVPIEK